MEITINLDDDAVVEAVNFAVKTSFEPPVQGYSRSGDHNGYVAIKRQVDAWAAEQDFTTMIQAAAKARLSAVVDEVVTTALREVARKRAKEMTRNGELFPGEES